MFRSIVASLVRDSGASQTALYLFKVFKALDECMENVMCLKELEMMYIKNLDFIDEDVEDSAAGVLLLIMGNVYSPTLTADHLNYWFGGVSTVLHRSFLSRVDDVHRQKVTPCVLIVVPRKDTDLQTLVDDLFGNAEWVEDFRGEPASKSEMMSVCPRILGLQVTRTRVGVITTSVTLVNEKKERPTAAERKAKKQAELAERNLQLSEFYSTLSYTMKLNLSGTVDGEDGPVVTQHRYQLVSMIVRQTTWLANGNSTGHYETVCSMGGSEGNAQEWFLFNDGAVSRMDATDVLNFTGADSGFTWGNKPRKVPRANKLFVEYFQFVRTDCLEEYYRG